MLNRVSSPQSSPHGVITTKFYFSSRHHTINSEQFRITPINLDLPWIFTTVLAEKTLYTNTLYTNTDLKISLYVLIHIKIMSWKYFILNPKIIELFTRKFCIFRKTQPANIGLQDIPRTSPSDFFRTSEIIFQNIKEGTLQKLCQTIPVVEYVFNKIAGNEL